MRQDSVVEKKVRDSVLDADLDMKLNANGYLGTPRQTITIGDMMDEHNKRELNEKFGKEVM